MDEAWMREALTLAREALLAGETPVGCVIVRGGEIVARARNRREELGDPTAHAEMLAIREAARKVGNWRLTDCCIYVTLEPCPMCAMPSPSTKRYCAATSCSRCRPSVSRPCRMVRPATPCSAH